MPKSEATIIRFPPTRWNIDLHTADLVQSKKIAGALIASQPRSAFFAGMNPHPFGELRKLRAHFLKLFNVGLPKLFVIEVKTVEDVLTIHTVNIRPTPPLCLISDSTMSSTLAGSKLVIMPPRIWAIHSRPRIGDTTGNDCKWYTSHDTRNAPAG